MKTLLIPSTFTADEKNQYLRNYKIGELARAATTFSIDKIVVYYDKDPYFDSHGLGRRIVQLLQYSNTPPYLKKHLFKKKKYLKYAGVMPPLKAPHHVPESFDVPYRLAYVLSSSGNQAKLEAGLEKPITIPNTSLSKGDLVIINPKTKKILEKTDTYFGYEAEYFNQSLPTLLKELKDHTIIGTSAHGTPIQDFKPPKSSQNLAIVFGCAYRGLYDLLDNPNSLCDQIINIAPNQQVETIRTEEAVYYTLSLFSYLNLI